MGRRRWWLPQRLVARVLLLYSTALLLLVSLGFGLFASYTARTQLEDADLQVATLVSVMLPAVADAAVIGDYDTIKRQIERALDHPSLQDGAYIDVKGGRIEAHRQLPPARHAPDWLLQRVAQRLDDVNRPISVGGRDYGVLRLRFWSQRVAGEIWRDAQVALTLALLGLLVGVGLVWWPLRRWLGNLDRIRDFGQQLERRGELSAVHNDSAPLEFRQTFDVLNRAAASLQIERAQAAVTLAAMADGVVTTNREGQIVLVNPVLAGWLGHTPAALLGQPLAPLLPGLPAPQQAQLGQRLEMTGPAGSPRVLQLSCSPVRDEAAGEISGWVFLLRDVSVQNELERQLQHELQARTAAMGAMQQLLEEFRHREDPSLALRPQAVASNDIERLSQMVADMVHRLEVKSSQLRAIFSLSPDGFVSFNAQRRVHFVSPAFEQLTGLPVRTLMGLGVDELEQRLQALVDPADGPFELQQLRAGKRLVTLSPPSARVLELALHLGDGREVSQVLHVCDVTHQVEVDRAKSEFLSMAAHELRTPMSSIYGFAELMLMRQFSPERQREIMEKIHRQSEAIIVILNELLDLARLEARGGQDFQFEALDAREAVGDAVQDFGLPEGREAPQLQLTDAALPVWVDAGKLQRVLRNLLSNAYKYSPLGGTVALRLRREDERVCIEVQDHGIGMSEAELAHVTERFYRADKSGQIPGTGLGMSIVKDIMGLMHGGLSLRSAPGQGTTVTVWLPLLHTAPAPAP